jgi:putative ABC transport system permease protein
MKFIDVIGTAIGNSFRSKLRTTLTVIAIFIGAFTLTITSAIGTGVSNYINTQVAAIGASDVLTVTKASDSSTTNSGPARYDPNKARTTAGVGAGAAPGSTIAALTQKDLDTIGASKGIRSVDASRRISPDYIEYGSNGKYELSINASGALTKADLAAGMQLSSTSSESQLLVPTTYLKNLGLGTAKEAVGKTVTIGLTDYAGASHVTTAVIVGVQNETLFGSGVGINKHLSETLNNTQSTGKPADATPSYASAVAHFDAASSSQQIASIKKALTDKGYSASTVADQIGSFETVINGIIGVLNAFAVIALIAAGFGIINTLLMSVQERTREIGLMKAMGMSGGKVYALFSTEAVFIGFLGSAIGAIVAIGVGSLISSVLATTLLSGLPGLRIMQFAPSSIAVIIGVVMLIAFLAGTLPARRAARQNPIDALRYE